MEKYNPHKLASICQRMPLDVQVVINLGDGLGDIHLRVVKSEFCTRLREMDGRQKVQASLTLACIYVRF